MSECLRRDELDSLLLIRRDIRDQFSAVLQGILLGKSICIVREVEIGLRNLSTLKRNESLGKFG